MTALLDWQTNSKACSWQQHFTCPLLASAVAPELLLQWHLMCLIGRKSFKPHFPI